MGSRKITHPGRYYTTLLGGLALWLGFVWAPSCQAWHGLVYAGLAGLMAGSVTVKLARAVAR